MQRSEPAVVQQHHPGVRCDPPVVNQLAKDVALAENAVRQRLDHAVAGRIVAEIDRPVLRKIDLPALPLRPQELSRVIAAGERDRVQPDSARLVDHSADAMIGEIPSVGVDRAIGHTVSDGRHVA
jgi:hypothetical protein